MIQIHDDIDPSGLNQFNLQYRMTATIEFLLYI